MKKSILLCFLVSMFFGYNFVQCGTNHTPYDQSLTIPDGLKNTIESSNSFFKDVELVKIEPSGLTNVDLFKGTAPAGTNFTLPAILVGSFVAKHPYGWYDNGSGNWGYHSFRGNIKFKNPTTIYIAHFDITPNCSGAYRGFNESNFNTWNKNLKKTPWIKRSETVKINIPIPGQPSSPYDYVILEKQVARGETVNFSTDIFTSPVNRSYIYNYNNYFIFIKPAPEKKASASKTASKPAAKPKASAKAKKGK